jgi:hypothetical protein
MTSIPNIHKRLLSLIPLASQLPNPLLAPGNMEAELQAQIPGLDHIISEYSVVCRSAKNQDGDCVWNADQLIGLLDSRCQPLCR